MARSSAGRIEYHTGRRSEVREACTWNGKKECELFEDASRGAVDNFSTRDASCFPIFLLAHQQVDAWSMVDVQRAAHMEKLMRKRGAQEQVADLDDGNTLITHLRSTFDS